MAFFLVIIPTALLKKKKTKIASEITVFTVEKYFLKKIKYFYFKLIILDVLRSF